MPRFSAGAASLLAAVLALSPLAVAPATAATGAAVSAAGNSVPMVVDADGPVTWSVEPSPTAEGGRRSFNYDVDPGTQIVDSFLVTNAGTAEAEFVIYATDAFTDPDTGSFGLLKREERASDLGSWITPSLQSVTIGPGMQATIPFNLVIPSDATPGDHSAGVVAAVLTTTQNAEGSAVVLEQRVGARVYMTVSGAVQAGVEVQGLTSTFSPSFNPFAPGELTVRYDVRNTGNKRLDVVQALRVDGIFGIATGSREPEPVLNILPRQVVHVQVTLSGVAALLYAHSAVTLEPGAVGSGIAPAGGATPTPTPTAVESTAPAPGETAGAAAVVDPDQSGLDYKKATSQTTTVALTWTLLALIALIVLIVVIAVRYVRGTREQMYAAIDEAAEAARQDALAGAASTTPEGSTR